MDYDHEYFEGKTAVVTGAASGIGLALIEELLLSKAAKVVLADVNKARLDEQVKRLQLQYSGQVKGMACDVTIEQQVQELIAEAIKFFDGRLDLLFNNAGAIFRGWFTDLSNSDWKTAFDLNFYGALFGMRAALPIMVKQKRGQIVNTISGIAFMPMADQTRYAATKAALNALTIALRTEYWDDNIKISSATPGTTATAIWSDFKVPQSAQTPKESASRMLHGVTRNDRVIYGSDADAKGGTDCFDDRVQEVKDYYLLNVARERRKGNFGI